MTKAKAERLYLVIEECGEVIQRVTKILRFGYSNRRLSVSESNQEALEREIGDLWAALGLLRESKDIRWGNVISYGCEKKNKIHKFLKHQGNKTNAKR